MNPHRIIPDPRHEVHNDVKFSFNGESGAVVEIIPTITMFLPPELIIATPTELCDIDCQLIEAMKTLVTAYKLLPIPQKEIRDNLRALRKSAQAIQRIVSDERMLLFLYDTVPPELLAMRKDGQSIMPFNELLCGASIQICLCERLLKKHGKLPSHRPIDTARHTNSINKEFVRNLMAIFERATGRKATASSESTRNRGEVPLTKRLKGEQQDSIRSQSPFEVFAHAVIQVINDSYDGLNNGHQLVVNVNGIVKVLNKR